MERYTIFFITVSALHVSGGFSVHLQELKNCRHSMRCVYSSWAPEDGRRNCPKHVELDNNKEYCTVEAAYYNRG